MYFIFLWEVVKRAFTPAPRVTDMLQILAASALPAASHFLDVKLPVDAGSSALAYIGLIAVSFVLIRLVWAPYAIWREQGASIGALKLELSKPERLLVEETARLRAKERILLANSLYDWHIASFPNGAAHRERQLIDCTKHHQKCSRIAGACGFPEDFVFSLYRFSLLCERRLNEGANWKETLDFRALQLLQSYVSGSITDEDLKRRWPQSTVA